MCGVGEVVCAESGEAAAFVSVGVAGIALGEVSYMRVSQPSFGDVGHAFAQSVDAGARANDASGLIVARWKLLVCQGVDHALHLVRCRPINAGKKLPKENR